MKLFYVMGGGMGHLYRVSAFIHQFEMEEYRILTANPLVYKLFSVDKVLFISADNYKAAWSYFVTETLPLLPVTQLYIDTFPNGIDGELRDWPKANYPVFYLARRLRWEVYHPAMQDFHFNFFCVYQLEELEIEHQQFIKSKTSTVEELTLAYPPAQIDRIASNPLYNNKPCWLIVHTFNKEELESLVQYAQEVARQESIQPFFLVLSDQTIEVANGQCVNYFPAVDWFPGADRIFAGGGFNTVQQVKPFLTKTTLLPFPRKYDDQAWRIETYVTSLKQEKIHS